MVNRDQDVMERTIHSELPQGKSVSTGPLNAVYTFEPMDVEDSVVETMNTMDAMETSLAIDPAGHRTLLAADSISDIAMTNENLDLFKLQDEEPADTLEAAKEPP